MGLDGSGCFSLMGSLWSQVHPLSDLVASGVRWESTVYEQCLSGPDTQVGFTIPCNYGLFLGAACSWVGNNSVRVLDSRRQVYFASINISIVSCRTLFRGIVNNGLFNISVLSMNKAV